MKNILKLAFYTIIFWFRKTIAELAIGQILLLLMAIVVGAVYAYCVYLQVFGG